MPFSQGLQAIAIGLSEARTKGKKVPAKKKTAAKKITAKRETTAKRKTSAKLKKRT